MNIEFITKTRSIQFPTEWYAANSEDHVWFQWRARVARMLIETIALPTQQALKVLDIGCGTGITCRQLARHTQWMFDGVDLNVDALARCDVGRGRVLYYDILEERPDFAEAYDAAVLFDTLEHIEDTEPFLRAVLFHLKEGGVLLVNVPALMGLYGEYDRVAGHYRRYTRETLAREFAAFDVTILEHVYWGLSMLPLLWLRKQMLRGQTNENTVIQKGFVPPHPWVHWGMKALMGAETRIVRRPPMGSSVMIAVCKRTAS